MNNTPSPAAMRAAQSIYETFDLLPHSQAVHMPQVRDIVAAIIDRETGNRELLEALQCVEITIRNLATDARNNRPWNPMAAQSLASVADNIRDVLARAEGRE